MRSVRPRAPRTSSRLVSLSRFSGATRADERNTESEYATVRFIRALTIAAALTAALITAVSAANEPCEGKTKVMALNANAFDVNAQNDSDQTNQNQRRRISALLGQKSGGLGALFAGEDDTSNLSKDSLNGGDVSSPLATPSPATNAPGEVSNLATERVGRAPAVSFSQVPILQGADQGAAAVSEAARGEVGSIGGTGGMPRMDTAARNRLLSDFFKGSSQSAEQNAQNTEPSDLSKAVGSGKSAVGAAGRANRMFSQSTPGSSFSTPFEGSDYGFGRTAGEPGAPTAHQQIGIEPTGTPQDTGFNTGDTMSSAPSSSTSEATGTMPGGSSFSLPDFTQLKTYGQGLGLLGSLAGLYGSASGSKDIARAGSAAGVAGQGINAIANPGVASGAGAVGAGLSLAGNLAGNKDLSTAGNLLGAGASLYGLGSGISSALASGAAGGAAGAGAGAGAGAAAGAGAGVGAGAGTAAAGEAASLGAGAVGGLAGGVLAIPGITDMLMRIFSPESYGMSRYQLARDAANAKAESATGTLRDLYSGVPENDLPATFGALRTALGERGAVRSYLDPGTAQQLGLSSGEWSQMSPQEFVTAMNWLSEDPSRLSAVQGSGDIGYLDNAAASGYGGQAAEQARVMLAKQLGLPYASAYGIGPTGSYSSPEDIRSEADAEQRYQALRDQWQQAHPNAQLEPWSPQFYGQDIDRLAQEAEVRRAYGLDPNAQVTPSLMDLYLSRRSNDTNSNTL